MPKVDKCTRQRRAAIRAALARGHTRTEAATLAGISPSTLWAWLAEGAKPDGELRYRRMLEAVEGGEADCVRRALDTMEDLLGADTPHATRFQAARFRLMTVGGRSEKQSLEVTGAGGGPVRVDVDPADAIRALAPLTTAGG